MLHIPNDCSATGHLSFLLWGAYELQLVSYGLKTVSKDASHARLSTSGAFVYLFQVWHVNQATPGLLNTSNCE